LLELLKELISKGNTLPNHNYDAKKIVCSMCLEYKIHARPNDCVLYKIEFATLRMCPTCGLSQFKRNLMEVVVRKKQRVPMLKCFGTCQQYLCLYDCLAL